MIAILLKSQKEEAGISLNVCVLFVCLFVCLLLFVGAISMMQIAILLKSQYKEAGLVFMFVSIQ